MAKTTKTKNDSDDDATKNTQHHPPPYCINQLRARESTQERRIMGTNSSEPAPSLTAEPDEAELRRREISTAAAVMSIAGPCRQVGDIYLACVATAGLGMCRQLRATFEQCAKGTAEQSTAMLGGFGEQVCAHVSDPDEQLLCAAQLVNQQLMRGYGQQRQQ